MSDNTDCTEAIKSSNKWLVILILISLSILAYGCFYSKASSNSPAYLFGYNLPVTLIVFGLFYPWLRKNVSSKKQLIFLFSIFISFIASDLISYSRQKTEAGKAVAEIKKGMDTLTESAIDKNGVPQRIEKPLDTTPVAKGELGQIEEFSKTFMNKMVSQRNNYFLEIDAIGWNTILDADRIAKDKNLSESRLIVKRAKSIIDKYSLQTAELFESGRKSIESMKVSASTKKDTSDGFERGLAKSIPLTKTLWELELKSVKEIESIISLLASRKNKWEIQDGKVVFANTNDLNEFNRHLTTIQELVKQEETIQKKSLESARSSFKKI